MNFPLFSTLVDLSLIPPLFFYLVIGVLGAIIGSFLNVVIHRLPQDESVIFPSSRCPQCSSLIAFYDNIPVLSYLALRGRCRSCKAAISPRYPAVELLTALLFVAVLWRDGLTPVLGFDLVFVSAIVALIFIDATNWILPDAITLPGVGFAIVARLAVPYLNAGPHFDDLPSLTANLPAEWPMWAASLLGALLGALVGGGFLWLTGWTWEKLRNVEAMGLGDVKMMLMVGAYLGWRLTILTIFLAVLSGSVTGVALMIVNRERNLQRLLPFGIFLGLGSIVSLLFGVQLVGWYAGQF